MIGTIILGPRLGFFRKKKNDSTQHFDHARLRQKKLEENIHTMEKTRDKKLAQYQQILHEAYQ